MAGQHVCKRCCGRAWAPGKPTRLVLVAHNDPLGTTAPRITVQVKRRSEAKIGREGVSAFIGTVGLVRLAGTLRRNSGWGRLSPARPRLGACEPLYSALSLVTIAAKPRAEVTGVTKKKHHDDDRRERDRRERDKDPKLELPSPVKDDDFSIGRVPGDDPKPMEAPPRLTP